MQLTTYRLSNRFEPLALAPWLLAALAVTALLAVAWTGCVWAFAFIPQIFFVRTALGIAACLVVGGFFGAAIGVCLQEGKLRHPNAVFWITVVLAAAGLLAHLGAWPWLFPHLPYGPQLIGGLVLVGLTAAYGGWSALREELFCESCLAWGVRHRAILTIPGDDPARFLDELASEPRTSWTKDEQAAAKQLPTSSLDLWACPCGKSCALSATTHGKDDRKDVRLRFVALPAELAASLQRLRAANDDDGEEEEEPEAEEETKPVYRETRAVYRSWLLDAGLWLTVAIYAGLAAIVIGSAAGVLFDLWRLTNGLPETRFFGLDLKDFVFTGAVLGVGVRVGYRGLRRGFNVAKAKLSIELFPDRIAISLTRVFWEAEIALDEVEDARLAEYQPRHERRRLASGSMRSNVLATCLFVHGTGTTRGIRLQLRGGDTVHLGLENPEAFLGGLAKARNEAPG